MDAMSKEEEAFVAPTCALQAALFQLRDEYFQVCDELGFIWHDRPLQLLLLALGRIVSDCAHQTIVSAEAVGQFPKKRELLNSFVGVIHEGAKLEGPVNTMGYTIQ